MLDGYRKKKEKNSDLQDGNRKVKKALPVFRMGSGIPELFPDVWERENHEFQLGNNWGREFPLMPVQANIIMLYFSILKILLSESTNKWS